MTGQIVTEMTEQRDSSFEGTALGPISGLWRSEEMELRSMNIERSVLEKVVRRFGELGLTQFEDMNSEGEGDNAEKTNRRGFLSQVRTCEMIGRSWRFLDEQIKSYDTEIPDENDGSVPPLGVSDFVGVPDISQLPDALESLRVSMAVEEEELGDQVEKLEQHQQAYDSAVLKSKVLSWSFQSCAGGDVATTPPPSLDDGVAAPEGLGQLVGTLPQDKLDTFTRLLYRVSRGNVVLVTDKLDDENSVFRILYSSFDLQSRILKLVSSTGGALFLASALRGKNGAQPKIAGLTELPGNESSFFEVKQATERIIDENAKLLHSTKVMLYQKLETAAKVHTERRHFLVKEQALYHCLNMMQIDKGASFASALAWIPTRHMSKVEDVLNTHNLCRLNKEDLKDSSEEVPPTYFETNEFTGTFQGIVDSYGVPRYQEVNPTSFTIVTFPWLFGIMYGDVGHGVMITLSAVAMIYFQEQLKKQRLNEIIDMVFGARWLLLLMGLFATYIGFLYNDTFGMMFEYSPSRFLFPDGWSDGKNAGCYEGGNVPLVCAPCHINETVLFGGMCTCPNSYSDLDSKYSCPVPVNDTHNYMAPSEGPTPFGLDVAWQEADNKLSFLNSYKMKNAIIVGVLQMSLGLFLSLQNFLYFKDWKHIFFGFIPECIFLFCTFGYMCVMLIAKWVTPWPNTNLAPNILETMTNFFLSPGKYNKWDELKCQQENECSGYDLLYSGQVDVQTVLIIIAVAAVPLMLLPIPLLISSENKKKIKEAEAFGVEPTGVQDMQEVWIKQVIHCIEFVLGCVSNTASYLRLWALSLAHAELSEVFWHFAIVEMLNGADGVGGGFVMWFAFGAWISATIGVLLIMEALSAFLHSLRLHWVEFQNKFYVGDGRKFTPLDFDGLIAESDANCTEG